MKKFYSCIIAFVLATVSFAASAYSFTVIVDDPSHFVARWNYRDVNLVEGPNLFETDDDGFMPEYTYLQLSPVDGYYIASCVDENGDDVEWDSYMYAGDNDGKTFTLTSASYDEVRTSLVTVKVDNPAAVNLKRKADSNYYELQEGENSVKFSPALDSPFRITAASSTTPLYKVFLNTEEVAITNGGYYGDYYELSPADGDVIDIQANYPDKDCKITLVLPDGIGTDIINYAYYYENNETVNYEPAFEFIVPAGKQFTISLNQTLYNVKGYTIGDGPFVDRGSISLVPADDVTITVDAALWGTIPATLVITDPAHISVFEGYSSNNKELTGLVAGENAIEVSESLGYITVIAKQGHFIRSITNEKGDTFNEDAAIRLTRSEGEDAAVITVESAPYATDPVQITWDDTNAPGIKFTDFITRVYLTDQWGYELSENSEVEFDDNGFSVLPGSYFMMEFDTDIHNIRSLYYLDGSTTSTTELVGSWHYGNKTNKALAIEGGVINGYIEKKETVKFSLTVDDADNVTIYRGFYYSGSTSNTEVTGIESGVKKDFEWSGDGYYDMQITIVPASGYAVTVRNVTTDTEMERAFNVENGMEYVVSVEPILRDAQAVFFVDGLAYTDRFNLNTASKEDFGPSVSDGYNIVKFSEKFDSPFEIFANGDALWTDECFTYLNDELIPLVGNYGYTVYVHAKDGDVVKVFLATDSTVEPDMYDVTFTVDGDKNFTVKKDIIAELADLSAPVKAHAGTQFDIIPDEGEIITVTVDGTPVEISDGKHTFTVAAATDVNIQGKQSGIDSIAPDAAVADRDVYNLQGIKVLDNATPAQIRALPAGLYIQGGQKIVVK